MSFKDAMSLIPSSVSVVSCFEGGLIYGCTISSLVSIDVREDNPEIIFVLKKQSLVGEKIKTSKLFTINILSARQIEIAQKYSAARSPDNFSDSNWTIKGNFAEILKCKIIMNCKLIQIYDSHAANIFVGKVIKHSIDQSQLTLIYNARRYGKFQSN